MARHLFWSYTIIEDYCINNELYELDTNSIQRKGKDEKKRDKNE